MPLLPAPGLARTLTYATLVYTVGRGLWLTASALMLTRAVGLSVAEVGIALSTAALVSLVVASPMGYLADRLGPRRVYILSGLALAVLTAGIAVARSFVAYLVLAVLIAVADSANSGARGAVIAGGVPADQRVRTRAYLRATTNVGISVGAVVAGLGIAVDTRSAYQTLILANAFAFLVGALMLTRLAPIPRVAAPESGPRLLALRDRPFLAFVALDGLMSMHFSLLNVALPLWIADHTDAPHWLISVLLLVNTTMVVLFQVRASRGTADLTGAGRASRRAGVAIAAACLLFAAAGVLPTAAAVALLVAGALAHVVGELWHSAAGWGISFGLAPAHAQGQYQGTYGMGFSLGRMVGPVLVTTLAIGWGTPGWIVLGVLFLLLGAATPPVVRWAAGTGTPAGEREAVAVG